MFQAGALAFGEPWLLSALVLLPLIALLLRVTPPLPKEAAFPPVAFLRDLVSPEEERSSSPLWLILLRLLIVLLLILAFSRPVLNPTGGLEEPGPLVLVVDDGWAAAAHWEQRLDAMEQVLDQAERRGRAVTIHTTAPRPDNEPAPQGIGQLMSAAEAKSLALSLQPHPWPTNRQALADQFASGQIDTRSHGVWLSDGVFSPGDQDLAQQMQRLAHFVLMEPLPEASALALSDLTFSPQDVKLAVKALRPSEARERLLTLNALDENGRILAQSPLVLPPGETKAEATLSLASEIRAQLDRITLDRERSASAQILMDERWRKRPVGLVSSLGSSGESGAEATPLLSGGFYLRKALEPIAEPRLGDIDDLLARPLSLLILDDPGRLSDEEVETLGQWVEAGGVLVRFAGPRMSAMDLSPKPAPRPERTRPLILGPQAIPEPEPEVSDAELLPPPDQVMPVQLRRGGRALDGTMSWASPATLAPFPKDGPFADLSIPSDITVNRQVLAQPTADLADRTWAHLTDGTPLVTGKARGEGYTVLIHVSANTAWSNLPLSGLYMEMLERLLDLSRGVGADWGEAFLAPQKVMDGFGQLRTPGPGVLGFSATEIDAISAGPNHPPGLYGTGVGRVSLNLTLSENQMMPLEAPPEILRRTYGGTAGELDLKPWLLAAVIALMIFDGVLALMLKGLLRPSLPDKKPAAAAKPIAGTMAGVGLLVGALLAAASPAKAQEPVTIVPADPIEAALAPRLAFVLTGDQEVDEHSQLGLQALTNILGRRTAAELSAPHGVRPGEDALLFYPLLYWPVTGNEAPLTPTAKNAMERYMAQGGMILFDTRDGGDTRSMFGQDSQAEALQRLLRDADLPPLTQAPRDHVLNRSFYLLTGQPGRFEGDSVWVARPSRDGRNDGVSPVVIGGADWAKAWAVDPLTELPLHPVTPGGENQREMAYRFGVNLVMYALTGNYKSDQVHMPIIMERLTQ